MSIAVKTESEGLKEVSVPEDYPGYDPNDLEKVFE